MSQILLVEDDAVLSDVLTQYLHKYEYEVDRASDGEIAWKKMVDISYDLILLDIGLPKIDGFQILKNFRVENNTTPIIIITSYAADTYELESYKHGSNLFHRKPINPRLLLHQIRSTLEYRSTERYCVGGYTLVPEERMIYHENRRKSAHLTKSELKVIEILFSKGLVPVNKSYLSDQLNKDEILKDPTNIESTISRLRKKLRDVFGSSDLIQTVHSKGYRLNPKLFSNQSS